MISAESRYASSKLATIKDDDGRDILCIVPSAFKGYTFSFTYFVVDASERIDQIANAYYGDPTKWWQIADANPEVLDWSSVSSGTVIRIPNT